MSPSSIFESPKGRRIREINNQLINQFHPAESRAFHAYAGALFALAHSGDGAADVRARRHAERLRRTVQMLERIHAEQTRWVEYFAKLSVITSQNYETEKERLKNIFNSYSKKEKTLIKTLLKSKHTRFDMEDFYEEELSAAADQQTQRYRFFAERHDELLKRSREWAAATVRLASTRDDASQACDSTPAGSDEADGRDTRSFSERRRSFELASTEKLLQEWRRQASLEQRHLNDLYAHAKAEQRRLDQQNQQDEQETVSTKEHSSSRRSRDSKPSSSSDGSSTYPDDPVDGSSAIGESGGSERRSSPTSYRKTTLDTVAPHTDKIEQQSASRENSIEATTAAVRRTRSCSVPSNRQLVDGSPHRQHYRSICQAEDDNGESPTSCDDGEREEEELYASNRSYMRSLSQHDKSCTAGQLKPLTPNLNSDCSSHNIYEEKQRLLEASERLASRRHATKPPAAGATATPILKILQHQREAETFGVPRPDYPSDHVDSSASFEEYLHAQMQKQAEQRHGEKTREVSNGTPPISPVITQPPIFVVSDHGKVLECIIPYDACGDNQLTLDVGDRVILVKSGTRGWVLGRTEDGTRQGWYPAKFLRIA